MFDKVSCFFPMYNKEGNDVTRLISSDGSIDSAPICIQNFTHQFLAIYHLDMPTLRHWSNKLLKYKVHIPLVITHEYGYIPVKVRQVYSQNETPFGYFLVSAIADYEDCLITLVSGEKIPSK